jgi:hypothetical protein
LHDALADDCRQVRLKDADRRCDDGHDDHQADEYIEQAEVRPALAGWEQRLVEDLLGEQGIDDAQARRDQDQDDDHRDAAAVWPEETGYAPQEMLRGGGHCRQGYVRPRL